jgi:large subunit ribosomal protein L10
MPSQKNTNQLEVLKDKLTKSKSIVFANYSGLSVSDQTKLRAAVNQTGGEFTVAKNTLLKLALKDKLNDLPRNVEDVLWGPTAILFSYEDAIASLKALVQFSDEHELPEIKIGLLEDRILSVKEIKQLASLPTKDQLILKLINQLNAPRLGLITVLQGNIRKLVYVLQAIKDQKN